MTGFSAFRAGLREVLTLRAAERVSRAYDATELAQIRRNKSEASSRLRASRRIANPVAALLFLRDAHEHARRAAEIARTPSEPMSELDGDFEALGFSEAETLRDRADAAVHTLLASVESRTPTELTGLRIGRVLAIAVLVLAVAWPLARNHFLVHNVARGKPVITSTIRPPPETGVGITDGRTRGTYGVQTLDGKPAFVMVDLERSYSIRRVKVYNRGDGWFDDSLPISLDVSEDGVAFHEVARRKEHFDAWTIELGGASARFIRVTKDNGYLALNEIEVYARN